MATPMMLAKVNVSELLALILGLAAGIIERKLGLG